ncbi:MAG: PRC-barrel domain-containing protein [Gemmatimonadaceae bacterium]
MLYSVSTLKGFTLRSRDGDIGHVKDLYFDDDHWTIRYLVANTGGWLAQRKVLISPYALGAVLSETGSVTVDLSRKQIEESPSLETDKPVSRQFEDIYHGHFGWPMYWSGPYIWGQYPVIERNPELWTKPAAPAPRSDSHLRSTNDVNGHHVHATDGEIGHVDDFILDDSTWAIRYLVVDTRNWWPGKKVLLSPEWIDRVSWEEREVFVDLDRNAIRDAPEYVSGTLLTREFETRLHEHYERPGYWLDGMRGEDAGRAMSSSSDAITGRSR